MMTPYERSNRRATLAEGGLLGGLGVYLLGRRRHPLGSLLGLALLAGAGFLVVALWVYVVLALLAGAGACEWARRRERSRREEQPSRLPLDACHSLPGWSWPVAIAAGLVLAIAWGPLVVVAGGAIIGAAVGARRQHRGQLANVPSSRPGPFGGGR